MIQDKRRYLIYVDILGFEKLPNDIENNCQIEPRAVRDLLCNTIENRLNVLENEGVITKVPASGDSWVLVTDTIENQLKSIAFILDHQSPFLNHRIIPLEIALGTEIYDRWAVFNNNKVFYEDPTIQFLKTNILDKYKTWYKEKFGCSIKSTFIVLTPSMYKVLDTYYRDILDKVQSIVEPTEKTEYYIANIQNIQKRARYIEFFEKLHIPKNKIYDNIEDVYVTSDEYHRISGCLKENKIVFITGSPEYGKTYSAVRLLWEYFNNGYTPVWMSGDERYEREYSRKRLKNIESELDKECIIYFEDPFGKSNYERMEFLERELESIIYYINCNNAHVIITSPEEIFKEFLIHNSPSKKLEKYVHKINPNDFSYNNLELNRKIMCSWANACNCKWAFNSEFKTYVENKIVSPNYLLTPLRIRDFCMDTKEVFNLFELENIIINKSNETGKSFADEINFMKEDKILFLSFPFISPAFRPKDVKDIYLEMVNELDIKDAWDFEEILNWFKDDKIKVSNGKIRFSHNSYLKSFWYLISKEKYPQGNFRRIFSKLIIKLAKNEKFASYVSRTIVDNYIILPGEVQNLLKYLVESKNSKVTGPLSRTLVFNYASLPKEIQVLLFKLYKQDKTRKYIARAITDYFYEIPAELQNLLFSLAKDDKIAGHLARGIADNYNQLPENIQNLFFEIYEKDMFANYIARAVGENYDQLPEKMQNILFKLASDKNNKIFVADALSDKFRNLPEPVRLKLLFDLAKDEKCFKYISKCIIKNFQFIPTDLHKIILTDIEYEPDIEDTARTIESNFHKFPEEIGKEILFKLADKEKVAKYVIRIIVNNFYSPLEFRKLLLKLLENNIEILEFALDFIEKNPNKIPFNLHCELLCELPHKWNSKYTQKFLLQGENHEQRLPNPSSALNLTPPPERKNL